MDGRQASSQTLLAAPVGRRRTPQRALLLELINGARGHLDADSLHALAKQRDPRISLSTVYRTIALLKRRGLLAELHFEEAHHHYEARAESEHCHLVCSVCGSVREFDSPLLASLRAAAARESGFALSGVRVEGVGVCPECLGASRDLDVLSAPSEIGGVDASR